MNTLAIAKIVKDSLLLLHWLRKAHSERMCNRRLGMRLRHKLLQILKVDGIGIRRLLRRQTHIFLDRTAHGSCIRPGSSITIFLAESRPAARFCSIGRCSMQCQVVDGCHFTVRGACPPPRPWLCECVYRVRGRGGAVARRFPRTLSCLPLLVVNSATECAPTRRNRVALPTPLPVPVLICRPLGPVRSVGPVALDALVVIRDGVFEVSRDGVVLLKLRQFQVVAPWSFAPLRPLILSLRAPLRSVSTCDAGECPAAPAVVGLVDPGKALRLVAVVVEIRFRRAVPGLGPLRPRSVCHCIGRSLFFYLVSIGSDPIFFVETKVYLLSHSARSCTLAN